MNYSDDKRIVMTLDAGGTNFVFSALSGGKEIVKPIVIEAEPQSQKRCLDSIEEGFRMVMKAMNDAPVAISFAFPGPADYPAGIIGDLPNFPSFRGGVALGPFLKNKFNVPVFINNDGDLFAYGEALTGVLPDLNRRLEESGSKKRYRNLLGITLGTGFGAGVVINGHLLRGDNAAGGDVWCFRNVKYPQYIAEESVSIRAIKRVYRELSGETDDLTPKDIFDIAEGHMLGNVRAAQSAFAEMGYSAGETIATALTLVDGIVVIGGGITGAAKYFMPALLYQLNSKIGMMDGSIFPRMQQQAFDLDDPDSFARFVKDSTIEITVPGTDKKVDYSPHKRTGVLISKQGASQSIALGAYMYALNHL